MATKEELIVKYQAKVDRLAKAKLEADRQLKAIAKGESPAAAARKERNHKVYLAGGAILELSKTDKAARSAIIRALESIKKESDKESVAALLGKLKAEAEEAKTIIGEKK
jgi:murein L,D-transpeptidase YcbB/YkuD